MEPITRKELFMAKAAGQNVNVPEPITREEKFLKQMADNSVSKYFGESTEVLFDQRVELADGETVLPYNLPISDGDLVAVTIDGFKYEVNAFVDVTGAEVCVTSGSEENPDFIVITSTQVDYQNTIIVVPNKASAAVKIEKPVIHTIDPKFLPVDYLKQLIAEVTGK